MNKNKPIGVFDSGIGGLNVLKELQKKLPNEDYIYVADTLHCPYGIKKPEEIKDLVNRISNYLIKNDCKAIVIACNTATTYAEDVFALDDIVTLGVIEPTALEATKSSKNILILATNATINSRIYQNILLNANKNVFPVPSSILVEPIEKGEIGNEFSYNLVKTHLRDYGDKNIDTAILGCTHFALYTDEIQSVFPTARIVNSGVPTSNKLYELLFKKDLLNNSNQKGKIFLKTTLDEKLFEEQIKIFNLEYNNIEKIEI